MGAQEITQAVSDRYARAATAGEQMCCPTTYNFAELRTFIPEEVLKISYGCGTPVGLETVGVGETVLDIGSGGGIDCFAAARGVGPTGRVIGVDMTEVMLEIARRNAPLVARNLGYLASNVEFRKGLAEAMPVEDSSVDLVVSNCVINLAPDKRKVFAEMYRVIRPGGRFTISDIVADQPVPQYLLHDTEKWGDCLSGALTAWDYLDGLAKVGFRGLHQVAYTPWRVIDGIHFLSLTLTGYKLLPAVGDSKFYATLRGPFSRVVDEDGTVYRRGEPVAITAQAAEILRTPPYQDLFLLSATPLPMTPGDPRFTAILPQPVPCVWQGHFAILAGPFRELDDDDHHRYQRGVPLEICSKTLGVLTEEPYRRQVLIINRAHTPVSGQAVACDSNGACC